MEAMKKAQEFTSVAKDLQDQLSNTEIEASARDGQVTVTMTAQQVPLKVEVSDELVAQGSAEVSAAVTEAVIAAHSKSSQYMKEKMGNLTKGMCLLLFIVLPSRATWKPRKATENPHQMMKVLTNCSLLPLYYFTFTVQNSESPNRQHHSRAPRRPDDDGSLQPEVFCVVSHQFFISRDERESDDKNRPYVIPTCLRNMSNPCLPCLYIVDTCPFASL